MTFWTFWTGVAILYIGILVAIMRSFESGAILGCLGLFCISIAYFLED